MTTLQLSSGLIDRISKKISSSQPPTYYWDYRDELTPEQVNMLLSLPNGLEEVENDICSQNHWNFEETQREHVLEIVKQFRADIQKEQGEDSEKISDNDLQELIEEYSFLSDCPGVDANIQQLIRNSRSSLRIVLQLDLHHEYEGWQWERTIRYKDVKDILRLFNINPREVHKSFPHHPRRKGKPYIKPKDLIELWDNATHGGQYVIPITLSLDDYLEKRDHYHTGITLHKGTELWLHDYGYGSGSISVPLQKKLKIKKAQISYQFGDDRDTAGYGMDQVYGLYYTAWHNYLSPIITNDLTPQTLQPVEAIVRKIHLCNTVSNTQLSRFIRAYHDDKPKWGGAIPKPGEMMEWDIDGLWKDFPKNGLNFLRKWANPHTEHYAIKVRESIGQTSIIHCQLLVDMSTGKTVWHTVRNSERSQAIFDQTEEKLNRLIAKEQAQKQQRA